jgi:hypothetical protein
MKDWSVLVPIERQMKTRLYITFKNSQIRLSDEELTEIFSFITRLLKKHLVSSEYHEVFLKEQ